MRGKGLEPGYPIGQQNFKILREDNSIYVDKTMYIEKLIRQESRYYFLARPRRFGKSLFLSTLRYFFEGRRDLFKGLYVDSIDWDWQEYPVLYLDLNTDRYAEIGQLDGVLERLLRSWEEKYGVKVKDENFSQRFSTIIEAAHQKTGKQVVILVDEYDKPLVGNLNKEENFQHYRTRLASIYSNFKSSAEHIKLVFLTGVSRFSKLSVFSDLNNIEDITFDDEFADICGITQQEMLDHFQRGITELAEEEETDFKGACEALKENYDGYRFARRGSDIYNPWSLLNSLKKRVIANYWNQTGLPTIIAESLYNNNIDVEEILNTECSRDVLLGLDLKSKYPLALLFQTGYLTIKGYDKNSRLYTLGVPNKEVTEGLFSVLLPYYISVRQGTADTAIDLLKKYIYSGQPQKMTECLDIFLSGIPYDLKITNENNFQNALYILLTLIGVKVNAEVHTSRGRIDLVIKTPEYVYIIELKFDRDAATAMAQIGEKDYAHPYLSDSRRIFKIGANFSSKTRHIDTPVIREVEKNAKKLAD
ncbi:MAG: ATP-binding protein [Muribaculaceae bacterium]|nr:ATP-binding protein [Muribaculaceae bacterium]